MKSFKCTVFLLASLVMTQGANGQTLESGECRHYASLLSKYEREGVSLYNGITGQSQRLPEDQSRIRIERLRQLLRDKCRS